MSKETHGRLLIQERFILDATERICAAMEREGISQAELATRVGRSQPFVSHVLSGKRKMTLRTLADLGWALGIEFQISESRIVPKAENALEEMLGGRSMTQVMADAREMERRMWEISGRCVCRNPPEGMIGWAAAPGCPVHDPRKIEQGGLWRAKSMVGPSFLVIAVGARNVLMRSPGALGEIDRWIPIDDFREKFFFQGDR
jgi:transcriptional regulator with XRE-family HTH domain